MKLHILRDTERVLKQYTDIPPEEQRTARVIESLARITDNPYHFSILAELVGSMSEIGQNIHQVRNMMQAMMMQRRSPMIQTRDGNDKVN